MSLLSILLVLAVAVLSVAVKGNSNEQPKDWPEQFMINFSSNITTEGVGAAPLAGMMYYDWSQQVQRVDHAAGAVECTEFYATEGACTLIMNPKGMYRILDDPPQGSPKCCLDMDAIHASPPDWANKANPTYNGITVDKYTGVPSFKWTFDNLGLYAP